MLKKENQSFFFFGNNLMGLSSAQQTQGGTTSCQCKSDDLFAPLKIKMKVLKKIKKRMGLG